MTTYSTSLKLSLIGNNEDSGTWGTVTNTNWNLIEQAVAGTAIITMNNANYTLSNPIGIPGEAHAAVLYVNGTNSAIRQVVAPLVQKVYLVYNNTVGGFAITIGASTGAIVTIPNGTTGLVFCDGVNFYTGLNSAGGSFGVGGAFSVVGNSTFSGTVTLAYDPVLPNQAATKNYVDTNFVPITRNIYTVNGLTGGGPLTADLTLGLSLTGVVPGLYNSANLQIDSYGRVTAASDGLGALPPVGGGGGVGASSNVTSISSTLPVQVNGGTGPIALVPATVSMSPATATANGYLLAADWVKFNAKANADGSNIVQGSTWAINITGTAGSLANGANLGTPVSGNLTGCYVEDPAYDSNNGSIVNTHWVTEIMKTQRFFPSSATPNGYQKLPNGFTIQWGFGNCSTAGLVNTFSIAFPNFCMTVIAIVYGPQYGTNLSVANFNQTGFTCFGTSYRTVTYIALGI